MQDNNAQRRAFLKCAAGTGLTALSGLAGAQSFDFKPNQRNPDPSVQILDPSFTKYRIYSSTVEQVGTGMRWAEGPAYFPESAAGAGGHLLVSDIPNNRIMKYSEKDGTFSVFRANANYANGNARDRQGRLITCEHSVTRRITRTELDGKLTVLADNFEGKRLNAPNDIVVKSDDSIWFTDPLFGINGEWEGARAKTEQASTNVYRLGSDGKLTAVITDLVNPNGIAFSPDEKKLYVVEWKGTKGTPNRSIWSFNVGTDGTVSQQDQADRRGRPRRTGRLQGRPRRQLVVRLGQQRRAAGRAHGCGWPQDLPAQGQARGPGRGDGVQPTRQGHRLHPSARALCQPDLWRAQKQPALHGQLPLAVCAVC